ncbi:hypothetical protein [Streptomyces lavendulocolor]|uniref:hypothetical protein n=1 Tax=Streptomyces lavendulocolor TaxID=67316 RepID=UPI0033E3E7D9
MWTPHYAVLDGAYWLEADAGTCAYCASLLSDGDASDAGDEADEGVSAARQRMAGPFTGDTAPAARMVMITWFVVTTLLSVLLVVSR